MRSDKKPTSETHTTSYILTLILLIEATISALLFGLGISFVPIYCQERINKNNHMSVHLVTTDFQCISLFIFASQIQFGHGVSSTSAIIMMYLNNAINAVYFPPRNLTILKPDAGINDISQLLKN